MSQSTIQRILPAYRKGADVTYIAEETGLSVRDVTDALLAFSRHEKKWRGFTDAFKQVVAERDMNDVSRKTISEELGINPSTVKMACEQFGKAIKLPARSDQRYTELARDTSFEACPVCASRRVNAVDSFSDGENAEGVYCLSCGNEFFKRNGRTYQVNWEYID